MSKELDMMAIYKRFEKMHLKEFLSKMNQILAFDIDVLYQHAKNLIGTEKPHNLGFLKEKLKGEIEKCLKFVVKNAIYHLETYHDVIGPGMTEEQVKNISTIFKDAIKNE